MRSILVSALALTVLATGCATVPAVPAECRVRRPHMDIGVPLRIQMEVERVAVEAERNCMERKKKQ